MSNILPLRASTVPAFFSRAEFELFQGEASASEDHNEARLRLKEKLMALHDQVYPRMRELNWDLYPPPGRHPRISPALVTANLRRVEFMTCYYTRPETVMHLMRHAYAEPAPGVQGNACLGLRLDEKGLGVELVVSREAWVDGVNFRTRALGGAPGRRHLRQLLAACAGCTVTYEGTPGDERTLSFRAQAVRLVNLGVLDAALARYQPGLHTLRLQSRLAPKDSHLAADTLPGVVLDRLAQLYPLYDYLAWSPKNNYCRTK